eukprot:TRINITY_DN272340_c0_g1_i1.p1 TRINITY_DN272340_c0_g1~~TRINITY_DN272340_c0_g1_i1.p1  ORF type:complete len:209 (+),score=4.92 TRINITY_DN272340_c0_g1_i1:275-901(+)
MMNDIIKQFVILWTVIDPIGTIPVFLAITAQYANQTLNAKLAIRAIFISAIVLLFFIVSGEILLDLMDIPLSAFQIAGAIVLFIFALSMIFGQSKPEEEVNLVKSSITHSAVFPLAIPSIASPGAMMAVVLLTDNNRFSIFHQMITSLIMLSILIITLIFMLLATKIQKIIGLSGASLISRVMGLILASVAVNAFLTGVTTYFKLNIA